MTTSPVLSITEELLAELEQKAKAAAEDREHEGFTYDPAIELTLLESRFAAAANPATILALVERVRSLVERLEKAEKDAGRYRWLRANDTAPAQIWELLSDDCQPPYMTLKAMHDLDDAIDAAIAQEGQSHE